MYRDHLKASCNLTWPIFVFCCVFTREYACVLYTYTVQSFRLTSRRLQHLGKLICSTSGLCFFITSFVCSSFVKPVFFHIYSHLNFMFSFRVDCMNKYCKKENRKQLSLSFSKPKIWVCVCATFLVPSLADYPRSAYERQLFCHSKYCSVRMLETFPSVETI